METIRTLNDWPTKHNLFGVEVCATSYRQVVRCAIEAGKQKRPCLIDFMPVHGLVTAATRPKHRRRMNDFDIVAPDGHPVRWALNRFYRTELTDRVYGPELVQRLCDAAQDEQVSIYLYGSTPDVLDKLRETLLRRYPRLKIAGWESPPFRELTEDEDAAVVRRINDSGAGLVFIGLGCPRQGQFAWSHRRSIQAVQLCVGAAFDFIAGCKKTAPSWMQRRGLEWLFRLCQEPRRLFRRYLVTNTIFSLFVVRRMVLGR